MKQKRKTDQLQIRVSPAQKAEIRRRAKRAGMGMSDWVLARIVPPATEKLQGLLDAFGTEQNRAYALAELNELLDQLSGEEYRLAVSEPPRKRLPPYWENYLAATIETAAARKSVEAPSWTADVPPLDEPVFGSDLMSLRLHLLTHSPPAFRRRNIFIDSSVGDRV